MDRSKLEKITGCATVYKRKIFEKKKKKKKSPKWHLKIYSAEACIINMALELISESRKNKFIIFSDSISVLESLKKNTKFDNPSIIKILSNLEDLLIDNDVQICWVQSHTGISGNDQVDKATRFTLNIAIGKKFKIPYTEFKMKINKYILQQRQQCWNSNKHNKLLESKSTLGEWKQGCRKNRKVEVILSRLCIGHTSITHSWSKAVTNVLCMPDQIPCETHSHWMYWPGP